MFGIAGPNTRTEDGGNQETNKRRHQTNITTKEGYQIYGIHSPKYQIINRVTWNRNQINSEELCITEPL